MYKYKSLKIDGVRIDEHRLIIERHLGRKLGRHEVVHHKNGNTRDNRIDNLEVMRRSEHSRIHMKGCKYHGLSESGRKRLIESLRMNSVERMIRVVQLDKSFNLVNTYECIMDAERKGFKGSHISACCKGKRKTHHNFFWKYEKDIQLAKSDTSSVNHFKCRTQ